LPASASPMSFTSPFFSSAVATLNLLQSEFCAARGLRAEKPRRQRNGRRL
jgi:hypothetical protein